MGASASFYQISCLLRALPAMLRLFPLLFLLALHTGIAFAQKQLTTKLPRPVQSQEVKKTMVASGRKRVSAGKQGVRNGQFLRPLVLPVRALTFERLASRELWHDLRQRRSIQASAKRFIGFDGMLDSTAAGRKWSDPQTVLLYRKSCSDSIWTAIKLALPDYASHQTRGPLNWESEEFKRKSIFRVDTLNLDYQGEPEVLVTVFMDCCGTAVHTEYTAVLLIDVSEAPTLLLTALVGIEGSGGYSSDDKYFEGGYAHRKIMLKRELLVSRITTNFPYYAQLLTPLKPGRYYYRGGHLVWVRK